MLVVCCFSFGFARSASFCALSLLCVCIFLVYLAGAVMVDNDHTHKYVKSHK